MNETREWIIDARLKENAPLADRWYALEVNEIDHDTTDRDATRAALDELRTGTYPGVPANLADRYDFRARRVQVTTEVETW